MRPILLIASVIIAAACTGPKAAKKNTNPLNGAWAPVSEEMGGRSLPTAAFATQRLVIADSTYTFTAESVDKGVVRYHDDKMDIYGREGVNAGRHFTAIYKHENAQLTICYNLIGDSYPASFDTKGKPAYFMCVFERAAPYHQ